MVGTAAALGALPDRVRRTAVIGLFVFAAAVILICAKPFAESLIGAGTQLGIDRFLLVQWLAPLASEAPEFIIAIIFAGTGQGYRGDLDADLVEGQPVDAADGSLPIAYLRWRRNCLVLDGQPPDRGDRADRHADHDGGGAASWRCGSTVRTAWLLLALFVVQFPLSLDRRPVGTQRVYAAVAVVALMCNRRQVLPTLPRRSPAAAARGRAAARARSGLDTCQLWAS